MSNNHKRRIMIAVAALTGVMAMGACHPVAGDSAGPTTPPADAPSDAPVGAPADAPSSSN